MLKQFIQSIKEEKDGFSFDRPWRLEENSLGVVVPILRETRSKRNYITLAEAKEVKVEDTGEVGYIYVKNEGDKPILISRGEMFRGKSQERVAIHDHIIESGKGMRVCVRCIHSSKPTGSGTEMKYGGRAPYSVDLSTQASTWETVNDFHASTTSAHIKYQSSTTSGSENRVDIPTADLFRASDDLVNTMDSLVGGIKEVLKKIPFIKNQVGAIFFKENKLTGMDVYDLPDSWDAVKKDVIEKEGSTFIEKDSNEMFSFKPEKAAELIKEKLSIEFSESDLYSDSYRVIEFRSGDLLGEAIEYKEKIIHLTLWNKN